MKNCVLKTLLILSIILSFSVKAADAIPASAEQTARETGSVSTTDIKESEADIIKRFSLKNKFQRSPEAQIRTFYKNYVKYSEQNNEEKLKSLYSDVFINNDGFNKNTVFKMMEQSIDAYKDITYNSNIENIFAEDNYAMVDVHEFAMGSTTKKNNEIDDYGLITSDIYYTDYLRKEGNKWKITATVIKSEKVSLKYGEAKSMPVDITAPKLVPENCEYDVKVKIDSPDGVLVIGSIVNDRIVFPHSQKKDVFKSLKSDVLERVVRANNNGNNEYVSATIGITRASIEPPKVMFKMTGMAFVMSRVNIINENRDTDIKELVNETK
ncbi:MAG: hypothetical protein ACI37R_02365 [Candidatus Avigastranaerophilus sp.]